MDLLLGEFLVVVADFADVVLHGVGVEAVIFFLIDFQKMQYIIPFIHILEGPLNLHLNLRRDLTCLRCHDMQLLVLRNELPDLLDPPCILHNRVKRWIPIHLCERAEIDVDLVVVFEVALYGLVVVEQSVRGVELEDQRFVSLEETL